MMKSVWVPILLLGSLELCQLAIVCWLLSSCILTSRRLHSHLMTNYTIKILLHRAQNTIQSLDDK